jgi:hypothetical protein
MAAVTINSTSRNVAGSFWQNTYNVTGNTGDVLTVGMANVVKVNTDGTAITSYATAAGSVSGTTDITLTGTIAATNVQVTGR